jgi:hypothetical protein
MYVLYIYPTHYFKVFPCPSESAAQQNTRQAKVHGLEKADAGGGKL